MDITTAQSVQPAPREKKRPAPGFWVIFANDYTAAIYNRHDHMLDLVDRIYGRVGRHPHRSPEPTYAPVLAEYLQQALSSEILSCFFLVGPQETRARLEAAFSSEVSTRQIRSPDHETAHLVERASWQDLGRRICL